MQDRIEEPTGQDGSILDAALTYRRRGWSIIQIKRGTKKPPKGFRWRQYQRKCLAEQDIRYLFDCRDDLGLAVICGPVSGGLVCRDFDRQDAYDRWAAETPDLARMLPTVGTARGRHVYFSANANGIKHFDDGELRGAGYCLLPPSVHPTGCKYRWLVKLPAGDLPTVDPVEAGLFLAAHHGVTERTEENGRLRKQGVAAAFRDPNPSLRQSLARVDDSGFDPDVVKAIEESLPVAVGHRNRQVFELARALKAIPRLADANPTELERIVRHWHTMGLARGVIGTDPFEETLIDFVVSWPKVKFPKGHEPMTAIVERAKRADLPEFANRYESEGVRLLVAICRELQIASGEQPFFLSCRTAGGLLGVTHVHAWRWLALLQAQKVIVPVGEADRARRKAQRYRYPVRDKPRYSG